MDQAADPGLMCDVAAPLSRGVSTERNQHVYFWKESDRRSSEI